jgi:hypothetical protein
MCKISAKRTLTALALCLTASACERPQPAATRPQEEDPQKVAEEKFLAALESVNRLELFSVHPGDSVAWPAHLPPPVYPPLGPKRISGYGTFGSTVIEDAPMRKRVLREFREALADPSAGWATCFHPRRALRITSDSDYYDTDILVCFQCDKLRARYQGVTIEKRMSEKPRLLFNRLLRDAAVPLAPGAAFDDEPVEETD